MTPRREVDRESDTGRIVLTDGHLKGYAKRREPRDVWDAEQPGLLARVLATGRIEWAIRYRYAGKRRRLKLGVYPALTLAKARERAREARTQIDRGRDPVAEQRTAKAKRTDTVAALAAEYLEKHARRKKRTAAEDERVLDVYVLPRWRDRSVREITRRDVRDLVEGIADRGAPIMANRVLEIVRKMFNWAIGREWLDGNPAARIEKPGKEQSRDRVLDDDEIRALWALLERFPATAEKQAPGRKRATTTADGAPFCPISPTLAAVQKLRLLTAQRGGEVIRMRWADLDLDAGWWTVPAEHSKNGKPHRVPLTIDAKAIVEAQQSDADRRKGHVFTGREGAIVADRVKKAGAALSEVVGFEFRSHDLRRTAATRMAAAGVPRDHVSRVLNHTEAGPKATRTYDRYSYDAEKRAALETWQRELRRILAAEPKTGADVVSIESRRA
jgi:integrase